MLMVHSPERLLRLDGLRGVAAGVISFIFHARILFGRTENPLSDIPGLGWFQLWGWSMVDLFFVLSGFVFAHCYLDGWRLRAGTTISSFALSRFARLWPLHVVTLGLAFSILHDTPQATLANAMTSLAMLHVFLAEPTQTLNGPAWSLSVEAICYAVFIVAAVAGGRSLRASTVAAILFGIGSILALEGSAVLIGRGLLGFFSGVLLRRYLLCADPIPTPVLIGMAGLPFLVVPQGAWLLLTSLIAWPAAILLALRCRFLAMRPMVWLGDRSYTIYLVHVPIYMVVSAFLGGDSAIGWAGLLMVAIAVWSAIILVADLFYRYLEKPCQKALLRRFAGRGGEASEPQFVPTLGTR